MTGKRFDLVIGSGESFQKIAETEEAKRLQELLKRLPPEDAKIFQDYLSAAERVEAHNSNLQDTLERRLEDRGNDWSSRDPNYLSR